MLGGALRTERGICGRVAAVGLGAVCGTFWRVSLWQPDSEKMIPAIEHNLRFGRVAVPRHQSLVSVLCTIEE
jgi:hypothetical protein